jgi:hypothetical protein
MKWWLALAACAGCDRAPALPEAVAGARIGNVELGQRWYEVRNLLGAPSAEPVTLVRLGHARWSEPPIDVLFTSPDDATLTDGAVVIGIGHALNAARDAVESKYGTSSDRYNGHDYYPNGLAIEYGDDEVAERIAVFAPTSEPRTGIDAVSTLSDGVILDGRRIPVVDMHLHPGEYADMAAEGRAFIAANLPPDLQIYAPDLLDRLSDPWARHIGIAEQTVLAGVGHAVLFAVYAPRSTGIFPNHALLAALDDPRNRTADGTPWAWGLASIDFEGWTPTVAASRLAELRDLLARRPDRIIGIKLAHAHQGTRLDDPAFFEIYAVAAEARVPVLLHTGFSPFPGTRDEPDYYDPVHLDGVLAAYPDLDVVLSHIGQGDARAVRHALDLAAAHERVWLELSALGRPTLVDEDGAPASGTEPQYPKVLAEIRRRGLIGRTLFATDGPQYSGAIRNYLRRIVDGMKTAGYSTAEIEAVLSGNFRRLFKR